MDEAMALQAGLAGKDRRFNEDAKVAVAGARRAAVTGVEVGVVDHLERGWRKRRHQLGTDGRLNRHGKMGGEMRAQLGKELADALLGVLGAWRRAPRWRSAMPLRARCGL